MHLLNKKRSIIHVAADQNNDLVGLCHAGRETIFSFISLPRNASMRRYKLNNLRPYTY